MGPEVPPELSAEPEPREPLMGPNRSAFLVGLTLAWIASIVLLGQPGMWFAYAGAFAVSLLLAFALLVRARHCAGPA